MVRLMARKRHNSERVFLITWGIVALSCLTLAWLAGGLIAIALTGILLYSLRSIRLMRDQPPGRYMLSLILLAFSLTAISIAFEYAGQPNTIWGRVIYGALKLSAFIVCFTAYYRYFYRDPIDRLLGREGRRSE